MDAKKEEWRDVVGYEGRYRISNLGNVWSCLTNKVLSPNITNGYHTVCLSNKDKIVKRKYIHILEMNAFYGYPPYDKPEVNHIDGNRANNVLSNLEYVSSSENKLHSYRYLNHKISPGCTFETAPGKKKCRCVETGEIFESIAEAARRKGLNRANISGCLCGSQLSCGGYHWRYADED